jgi:hypothetical protein
MNKSICLLCTLFVLTSAASQCAAQDAPPHAQSQDHSAHHAGVNERGDHAMGFSHLKTTHHFILLKTGGSIEVSANDEKDTASRDQIRQHLAHIAKMFADGNFNTPMFIHATVPPGAETMKRLKSEIAYSFEKTEQGGRVKIETANAEALTAVHEFLRFQIEDHHTGDPLDVQ